MSNLFEFSDVILRLGHDPSSVRLVRHSRSVHALWRRGPASFDEEASFQPPGSDSPYHRASVVFQFVPGPRLPDGDATATLVRAHRVGEAWPWGDGERRPRLTVPGSVRSPRPEALAYDLDVLPEVDPYAERILIRWGSPGSTRSWSQWADRNPKEVVELRRTAHDPPFPGFSAFHTTIDEVDLLPQAWAAALSSVGGVYLLVCPETGEQYVGSASGLGGFYGRWTAYAENGHGGNKLLKARTRTAYAVTVLEVASPDMAPRDLIARETAWKVKLGSRVHGLNAN